MVVTNSAWMSEAVLVYDVLKVYASAFVLWSSEAFSQSAGISVTVLPSGPSNRMDIPAFR
jgi:hypothetical protein